MITIPTIAQIRDQIIADIEGKTGQTVPLLTRSTIRVMATALAGALALLYRLAGWAYNQIHPQTADEESLIRMGSRYGLARSPAVAAILDIKIVGVDGAYIPPGTLWSGDDNEVVYSQIAGVTIAGAASAQVEALTVGADGTLNEYDTLSLPSPVTGAISAYVSSVAVEGEDEESLESYREQVEQRMQNQPQGGAAGDYVRWALEVAGIVRAFAHRSAAGVVTIYPLQAITGADRVPSYTKITEVEDYCGSTERRPLCATVYAEAMSELEVDVTISGLDPNDSDTKELIESEVEAYLYGRYPRQYTDEVAPTHKVSVGSIWAIVTEAGATATAVTMTVEGIGATTSYTLTDGVIVKLGTLTWA